MKDFGLDGVSPTSFKYKAAVLENQSRRLRFIFH